MDELRSDRARRRGSCIPAASRRLSIVAPCFLAARRWGGEWFADAATRGMIVVLVLGISVSVAESPPSVSEGDPDALTFVRIKYDSSGGFGESWYRFEGRDWERWETDYPRAEKNLILRLGELTSLKVNPEPIVLELSDPRLRNYPFIFMSDVGWQVLSGREQSAVADYLRRGGFLWVDDFWGKGEWDNFMRNLGSLDPQWSWRRIDEKHPILSIVYDLPGCPQIPARIFYEQSGLAWDPPQVHRYPSGGTRGVNRVNFMGLFDRNNRLMAVATHNTDVADGWEREGESREFFQRFSIKSYAITINILVYAMTH